MDRMEIEEIQRLSEHGGRETGYLDFSTSTNPYQPEWRADVFLEAERRSARYPYFEEMDRELGEIVGDEVAITAGATEGIYLSLLIARALMELRRVLIPHPTYSEYERVSRIFGLRVELTDADPHSIAEKVKKGDVVFFCNPNNPDGRYVGLKGLKPIVEAVEDASSLMILDEAFKDFVRNFESPESDNVIKLRTFTKSYGMPGIRVGYVVGFAREIRASRMPWSIGCVGIAFIEKVIEDGFNFLNESMPKIWKEKERFEKELNVKSDANYFLIKHDPIKLKEKGILVRDCTSFGLPGYVRFSVQKPDENSKLIRAIRN
jgi:histidinol-phosphate aminotransferase